MLRLPYFAPLARRPEDLVPERCVFCSSDGDVTAAVRASTGRADEEGWHVVDRSLLFESDKVELQQTAPGPATRSSRGEQKEYEESLISIFVCKTKNRYSVFSMGGRKEKDDGQDAVEEFFREEEARAREMQRKHAWLAQRQAEEEEDRRFREELLREGALAREPLQSAAAKARLGLTLEEARQQPNTASFREAARLARQAEEELKMARKKKRLDPQMSSEQVDPLPPAVQEVSRIPPPPQ